MSAIEDHFVNTVTRELQKLGVAAGKVSVLSGNAEDWRLRIVAAAREFEIGFNHRDQLWVRETTGGAEKHLVSNDHPRIHASARAREVGLRLIAAALKRPSFPPRDPPVI